MSYTKQELVEFLEVCAMCEHNAGEQERSEVLFGLAKWVQFQDDDIAENLKDMG